jgi:hypothetical protein
MAFNQPDRDDPYPHVERPRQATNGPPCYVKSPAIKVESVEDAEEFGRRRGRLMSIGLFSSQPDHGDSHGFVQAVSQSLTQRLYDERGERLHR